MNTSWMQNIVRGLGTANAPFGFGPDVSPNQGAVDPAYNAGMQMIGNVGMGMLASGEQNPMRALGRSYLVAQNQAQDQNKNQYIAAQMMQAADEKKRQRQEEQDKKAQFDQWVSTLPPEQQSLAKLFPEKYGAEMVAQQFPDPQGAGGSANFGMTVVPIRNKKTGELAAGQLNQGQGGIFLNGQLIDSNEWSFDPGYLSQEKASGTAVGKTQGGAIADLPGATRQAEITTAKVDELASNKNLDAALGWTSYLPDAAVTNDVIDVRSKVDELMGGAFLEARTVLKGGGQITDFESARAERAYARMERAMQSSDPKVFRDALADFKQAINDGVSKLRATANGGVPAAPADGETQKRLKFNPQTGELE